MIRTDRSLHQSVVTVTMARPERRNALDAKLVDALTAEIRRRGEDDSIRVIVLAADGPVFSAGADLDALARLQDASREENLVDSRRLAGLFESILMCPVPVVARVQGHAIAGGCGLVAACDLAVAVPGAKFGFTEVRIGFVPAIVSVVVGARVTGSVMRDLFLTGRLIEAPEARDAGLVNRVVSPEMLDEAVDDLAEVIARETSRNAVAETKRLLVRSALPDLATALDRAARLNADSRGTADCLAGVRSFLDRSDPPWKTRW